ncbi:putative HD superfamily hydrolase involved in NAD metabolism [Planifilum fimeticola]|uniref:bis(5'-nucleosyl)-tetraphosphatase (symmetrical) n=1 Tax=Planifilum fimeticola TaxID=201975 RepID=A0A2T0LG25_9BACL|nr:putative HD superfamily hydrolase involved in NAD metabolism [Planifilum fimeticola]
MKINREKLMEAAKRQMPSSRWEHTLRVMETAAELARRTGADPEKADIAAILHDYCKFWPEDKQREWILRHRLPQDLLQYNKELWHAPVGAEAVREELGIDDEEVLNAIRSHTTGRPGMSLLEKVIFLADYIEPGRSFSGVEEVRRLAREDLDRAILKALDNTIVYLVERGFKVYPLTILTRNDFLDKIPQTLPKEESH